MMQIVRARVYKNYNILQTPFESLRDTHTHTHLHAASHRKHTNTNQSRGNIPRM